MKNLSHPFNGQMLVMPKKSGANRFKKQLLFLAILFSGLYATAQPVVTSLSASSGIPGASMTISGSGFNTTTTNNAVYFGATKAAVTSASATSLTVTIPVGATYMPVSVTNTGTGLTGYSKSAFLPTFDGSPYIAGGFNFEPKGDLTTGSYVSYDDIVMADIDGDGKPDLIATADNGGSVEAISVFRNTSTTGSLGTSSFASPVNFSVPDAPANVVVADMNGDGKPDLIAPNRSGGFSVFRNTATSGTISSGSFATRVDVSFAGAGEVAVGDIDGDGKPDVVQASYDDNIVSVFENTSSGTTISFAARVDFTTGNNPALSRLGDLDGDGKIDVIVNNKGDFSFSVFHNTSSGGTVTTGSLAAKVDFVNFNEIYDIFVNDIDGDGKQDVVLTNIGANNASIYRNTATSGSFTSGSLAAKVVFNVGFAFQLADINGDAKPDFIGFRAVSGSAANYNASAGGIGISFRSNNATSGTISSSSFAAEVILADLDGQTGFGPAVGFEVGGWSLAMGDMDGDSKPDFAAVSNYLTLGVSRNNPLVQPPAISSISATSGMPGSSLTITGTAFNTTPANNNVYFGSSKASVTSASSTSLTVTVPSAPTFAPVSVNNSATSLSAYSRKSYMPTFDGSSFASGTVNFDARVNFATSNGLGSMPSLMDVDGDGKLDMISSNGPTNTISVYRNISTSGSITTGSFASPVSFATASGAGKIIPTDVDGDGKLDIVVCCSNYFSVLRNIATPGSITSGSLATKVDFVGAYGYSDAGDIDGDGKPDLIAIEDGTFPEAACYILKNTAVPGVIDAASFASFTSLSISTGGLYADMNTDLKLTDIDGDGKLDMVITTAYPRHVRVLRNSSRMGAIVGNVSYLPGNKGTLVSFEPAVEFGFENSGFNVYNNVEAGDMDGDGKQDLVFSHDHGVAIMRNTATSGSITTSSLATAIVFTVGQDVYLAKLADMNGDGKLDIIATRADSAVTVYLNTATAGSISSGSLAAPILFRTQEGAYHLAVGDVDGDGKADMLTGAYGDGSTSLVSVHRNNPSTISGILGVYIASTSTLTCTISGGTWSSSSPSIATIGSSSGVVTGVASGTCVITYTYPTTGFATVVVTVCPAPAAITGTMTVCPSATTTLSNTVSGGTWSSSNTGIATIGTSGVVTGVAAGTCTITYYTGCGTGATATITINPSASVGAISGTSTVCEGLTTTYTNATSGGVWTTSNSSVATIGSTGIVTGVAAGTARITYTVTNSCNSAFSTKLISVNAIPAAITGSLNVCVSSTTTLSSTTTGGTWSRSNASAVSVGSASGIVTGIATGTSNITYTKSGCTTLAVVSVNSSAAAGTVSGAAAICPGVTVTLSSTLSAGTWSSGSTSVATVGSVSGIVTGVAAGTAMITYSRNNGCGVATASATVTVNAAAVAGTITGSSFVCAGSTITLSNATIGGVWSSGATSVATIGTTGIVSGIAAGTSTISYSVTNGCGTIVATFNVTVGTTPSAGTITGSSSVVVGATTTLSNAVSGGAWSSSNTSIATVGTTGIVTGVATGTTTISYSVTSSCGTTVATTNVTVSAGADPCNSWTITGTAGLSSSNAHFTSIAIDPSGIPYLAFRDLDGAYFNTVKKYVSGSWSIVGTAGLAGKGDNLSVVLDGSGTPYIGYTDADDDTGTYQAVVRKFNGTDWEMLGGVKVSAGSTDYTAIALDGSGTPYVVYQDADNGQKATVKKFDGTNWVTVGAVGFSAGIAGYTSIAIDGSGVPYVVYRDESNAGKATVMTFNGSSWVVVGSAGFSTGEAEFTTIKINSSGTPYVSYQDAASGYKATVKKFNGSTWVTVGTEGFSPDITNYNSLALDGSGTPYVVYMDYSNSQKATVKKFDGSNWVTAGNAGISVSSAFYTTIAINSSGTPYIAYSDVSDHKANVQQLNTLATITGTASICAGATTTLSNATSGGSWISSNTSVATVGSGTGVVTGVAAGTSTISYVLGSGCTTTLVVSVSAAPGSITGPATLCTYPPVTTTYTNATSGGLWSSSNPTIGSIGSASGAFRPLSTGVVTITYSTGTGCTATKDITVNVLAITVPVNVCVGSSATLTNATPGGVWSTGSSTATVGSATGVVTGISTGSAFIQYTVTSTGCSITSDINVMPAVASISGTASICIGSTSTLTSTTPGGSWISSNTSVATVGSASGVVTGIATGISTISYLVSTGYYTSLVVTVGATSGVSAITGTPTLCASSTTTLANATSGGNWSSSNTSVATVGSSSGVVSGVTSGTATITYMLASGCYTTQGVTVNATPSAITGTASLCEGNTTTLSNITPSGTWTSSNTSVATIGSSTGIVNGILAGTTTIAYTTGTGCAVTQNVTVAAAPSSISGTLLVCSGTTALSATPTGGTWTSSNTSVATVGTTGVVTTVVSGTAVITYSLGSGCNSMATVTVGVTPAAITGTPSMCVGGTTALSSTTSGGMWSSSNTSVATVGGAGLVTGIGAGNATISYTHSSGCIRTIMATVNASPSANTGSPLVCVGSTTTLGNATTGGAWSSGTPAKATVNATTGLVTGVSGGTVNISYTVSTGCVSITQVTVNTALAAITGTTNVCVASTTTFTHPISGGVWASSNTAMATVGSATGIITGVSAGTPTITYTVGGCYKTKAITINGGTLAITGSTGVCQGATSTLACTTPGGLSWISSNTAVATIGSTSGLVTAITTGTTGITYTATTGCTSTTVLTVLALPTAISGTMTLCQGATTTLASIGTTGGTWLSSVLSKATIGSSSGIVSGIGGGTSNISYTWTNGCKRTAQVTVSPLPTAGAIVGAGTMSVSATQTLTASSPGGSWTSGNPGRATIVAGTGFMTGVSVGTVVITYTNTNSCGSASVTRIFSITASRQSVFAGTDENVKFSVYPNPTSGQLIIEAPVSGVFAVYTIDGRMVQQYTIADALTKLVLPNELASGVYMCRFNGDDGSTVMTRLVVE